MIRGNASPRLLHFWSVAALIIAILFGILLLVNLVAIAIASDKTPFVIQIPILFLCCAGFYVAYMGLKRVSEARMRESQVMINSPPPAD